MTVYYQQFQTSSAHGLNIVNGDSRQVQSRDDGKVGVCVLDCVGVLWREVVKFFLNLCCDTCGEERVCVCFLAKGTTGVCRL